MPNEHRADPTPPPHHGQGRGGSKKESFSLRVSPALHPPERPSSRRADIADHDLGRETRERRYIYITNNSLVGLNTSIQETTMEYSMLHRHLIFSFVYWYNRLLLLLMISMYVKYYGRHLLIEE